MKKLFIILLLLFSFSSFAQTDSVETQNVSEVNTVWKSKPGKFPLKRGFYKSYEEYLSNSPSVQRNFTMIDKTKSAKKKANGICAVDFDIAEGEEKVGKVWGFCDGTAVYIKASPIENRYWKIDYIAPYSYFVHLFQPRTPAAFLAAGAMGTREFSVVNSHGKMIFVTENYLKKLLKDTPELLAAYKNEKDRKNEEVKKKYLQQLNDILAANQN